MLKMVQGDLFALAPNASIIAHGCNAQGKMKSGFAKELRRRFAGNYLYYRKCYLEDGLNVGDVLFYSHTREGTHIANIISQEYYGRDKSVVYVDYINLEKGLNQVKQYACVNRLPIYLPFIGGGLANGDRGVLMEIFKRVFDDVDATLCVDSLPPYSDDHGN